MLAYYPIVMMFCCVCLVALSVMVYDNSRLSLDVKKRFIYCYLIIFLAIFSGYINALVEGNPTYITLHWATNFLDFVLTPLINLFFLRLLTKDGRRLREMKIILLINLIIEIINLFTGWIFTISNDNQVVYGRFIFVHIVIYIVTTIILIAEFVSYGRRHPSRNGYSLFCIFFILGGSMLLQHVTGNYVRIACLGLTFGSALIFIHYSEFYQQNNDIVISAQERLIRTDVLTQLKNRYAYNEKAKTFSDNGIPEDLVLFSIDVNGLKNVNDTYGHEYGDALITGATCIINEVFGKYGTTYRVGGDEFMVVLENAKVFPGELGRELEAKTGTYSNALIKDISVSYGYVSSKEYPDLDFEALANVADKRMYEDKAEHYLSRGFDRRSIQDAYDAISSTYVKVLKVNLNEDTFQVVSLGSNITEKDSVYSSTVSGWTKDFAADGNVHPDDIEKYLKCVNAEYLKDYFDTGRTSMNIEYRRRVDFVYRSTLLEIIRTEGYSDNNRTVFMFVKYLNDGAGI